MPNADDTLADQPNPLADAYRWRFSLRSLMIVFTLAALLVGWIVTTMQLRKAKAELSVLRLETGYLESSDSRQIAAVRVPTDQSLTYRVRVRVPGSPDSRSPDSRSPDSRSPDSRSPDSRSPDSRSPDSRSPDSRSPGYRVAYSTDWPQQQPSPEWYSAIELPEGESMLTVQIQEDPRDGRWKITTTVRSRLGTKRMATVLPSEHVRVFRESHDVLSTGIGRQTEFALPAEKMRLLDERWLVGEGGLLLYGNTEPKEDIIGVFAELQPDTGPL